ncbi:MAG TPA: RNA-binding protein, partial [Polyangia bacterium]|nr:RNA-binding protein [Polyangia bacterium]
PELPGKVYVCPDVSGSMSSPVTGYRRGATTAVRCIDVAALVAAAILHKNPDAEVLPFEHRVVSVRVSKKDSVMTNARRLAGVGGGGTSCSAPLELLNSQRARGEMVIFVSDNESWVDAGGPRMATAMMREWSAFKARNPSAKLVCIDLVPNRTTQATEGGDVLNIGGFSDAVFDVLAAFAKGGVRSDRWVGVIEDVTL